MVAGAKITLGRGRLAPRSGRRTMTDRSSFRGARVTTDDSGQDVPLDPLLAETLELVDQRVARLTDDDIDPAVTGARRSRPAARVVPRFLS
jgi:hypothetical protein